MPIATPNVCNTFVTVSCRILTSTIRSCTIYMCHVGYSSLYIRSPVLGARICCASCVQIKVSDIYNSLVVK